MCDVNMYNITHILKRTVPGIYPPSSLPTQPFTGWIWNPLRCSREMLCTVYHKVYTHSRCRTADTNSTIASRMLILLEHGKPSRLIRELYQRTSRDCGDYSTPARGAEIHEIGQKRMDSEIEKRKAKQGQARPGRTRIHALPYYTSLPQPPSAIHHIKRSETLSHLLTRTRTRLFLVLQFM